MRTYHQSIKRLIHILLAFLLSSVFLLSIPAHSVQANDYVVVNTDDSGTGSLRQAITDANNNPGPDTITFHVATNEIAIVLSGAAGEDANASGDLDILDGGDLTIQGNGVANTILDGGGIDRILHNCPGGGCAGTVTLMDLTIRNGSVTDGGGGIYNGGTMTVDSSIVSSNTAADNGGGFYNYDALTIQNGSIIGGAGAGNIATLFGGGIYNAMGTTTVDGSTVSANDAAGGGGIYNLATLNIQNGTSIGTAGAANDAIEGGGIKNWAGTTTVDGSTVSHNTAGWGGGIFSNAALNIQGGSTIGGAGAGNTATNSGGGIYNGGTMTVDSSIVSANIGDNGGGIFVELGGELTVQNGSVIGGSAVSNLAVANGGGVYNKGQTWVKGSIVRDNTAGGDGGGIYDEGMLAVQNGSTIGGAGAGNTAVGDGGGIFNYALGTTVDASKVSANVASSDGGGIYNQAVLTVQNGSTIGGVGVGNQAAYDGGGIYNDSTGTTTVTGSRILNNSSTNGGGVFNDRNGSSVVNITGSCIVGNSAASLRNNQSPAQTATGDWWGAPAGPNTPGADTTSGNWFASGFLSAPILGCGYEIYLPLIMR
jgi:hypothetical protein